MGGIETAAVHSNNQSNSLQAWRVVPSVVTSTPNFCSPPSSILSSFGRMTAETRPFCDFSVFMLFKGIFGKLSKPFLSHRHFSSTFPQARLPLKSSRKVASIVKYTYFQVSWTQNQRFKEVIAVLLPVLIILLLFLSCPAILEQQLVEEISSAQCTCFKATWSFCLTWYNVILQCISGLGSIVLRRTLE